MFVTIVSVCIFVSFFVRVKKNSKKYENLMIFDTFVIMNRGELCQDSGKISWNFGSIVLFFMSYQRNITRRYKFSEKFFFRPTLLWMSSGPGAELFVAWLALVNSSIENGMLYVSLVLLLTFILFCSYLRFKWKKIGL